ncbi:site-specific integrase [Aliifodinibius salicampi]|uniref:Site-specific integrase n=1 Tax=Fodinibius salicampi TaxID=1920655 RepID=A0ABT3PZS7_9BACT|nr:site-specific integrase [Fodinibius salicampi]MCW9713359.1 site-specific integrase [Fodinibius salicampi]
MATTYHFYLRKDKKRDNGECPIYLRITQNRKSRYVSTGVYVKPRFWNPEKEEVRKSHRNSKSLNSILDREQDKAETVQAELSKHGKDSAKAIQERLKHQQTGDFFDLADEYLEEIKKTGSHYTHKNAKVAIRKVEAFEGSRSLPLRHIDTEYLERFERFLKDEYDNHPNTISKNFRPIKGIIRKALKKHLITINPLVNFEGAKRGKPKPKTKLSVKQIEAIQSYDFEQFSNLWHTRNYFMFSFYSGGIRFGDLCCLKWNDIKGDRLSYQMNKNEKVFTIELNEYQQEILDYYSTDKKSEDFIFPILNNHKDYSDPTFLRKRISSKNALINKWLGKIVDKVNEELEKEDSDIPRLDDISFHVARHSFAQYAVEQGLSMYELMQTLRHSKIETTQKYLKGLDEQLADKAMKKVF